MGLSGVSGPWRGAYNTFTFATGSIGANYGNTGPTKFEIWDYTVPAGMDIVIIDAQVYAGGAGVNARVNIEAGGTSIIGDATNAIRGVSLASGNSVVATPANSSFGTNPPAQTPAIGAYIVGGTALTATASNGSTATGQITGTILWYPVKHPTIVKSAFE